MGEITRVLEAGFTEQEVSGAIDRMRNSAVLAKDDFGTAAQIFGVALTSGGTVSTVENWLQEIEKVTPADALAAAKSVLEGTHHVTAELLPKPQS